MDEKSKVDDSHLLRGDRNVEANSLETSNSQTNTNKKNRSMNFYSKYSTLEKILGVLLFVTGTLCLIFIIFTARLLAKKHFVNQSALTSGYVTDEFGTTYPICEHEGCTVAASDIIQSMDESNDPCEDFAQFSCGGWLEKNPIPEDSSEVDQFEELTKRGNIILSQIIQELNISDSKPFSQLKALYVGCLNESQIELKGLKPLTDLLHDFGGWPMTKTTWNVKKLDWLEMAARAIQQIDESIIVRVYVNPDMKNTTENRIYLDQPYFELPRSMHVKPEDIHQDRILAYKKYIKSSAKLIAQNLNTPLTDDGAINRDVNELYNFETELAKITTPSENRRDTNRLYNKMSIQDLMNITDDTNWLNFFKVLFNMVDINKTTTLIVKEKNYIINMTKLINRTDKRTVVNYVLWKMVDTLADETTKAMRDIVIEYKKVAKGIKSIKPRNIICAKKAINKMGMAIGAKYTEKHFTKKTKEAANLMIENIRSSFNDMLSENEWMDEETKPLAIDKANVISQHIGYPDWFETDDGLELYYENLTNIDSDEHFKNILTFSTYIHQKHLKTLYDPVDKTKWRMSPAIVNAYYKPSFNSITFPAAILQPPFYRSTAPQYLSYGAIGQVIGHEITHGFDSRGRQYNKEGNAIPWWSENTIKKFKEKSQCIIDQYGGFRVPELDTENKTVTLKGKNTRSENIADNGGLRAAFRAYQNLVKEFGEEPRLPGLTKYTPEQLFFIANAQAWCSAKTKESLLNQILTDPHSPGMFRLFGSMGNMQEFSEIWNCPAGSRMNFKNKCQVW